jgi:hypothetical protein
MSNRQRHPASIVLVLSLLGALAPTGCAMPPPAAQTGLARSVAPARTETAAAGWPARARDAGPSHSAGSGSGSVSDSFAA